MTNHRVQCGHSAILLVAAAILSAHPRAVFSQDLESRSPSTLRSHDDSSSVPDQASKTMPLTDDAVVAALPDAPRPQDQSQDQSQDPPPPAPAVSGTYLNQFPSLPPGMTRSSLRFEDKFRIYEHK